MVSASAPHGHIGFTVSLKPSLNSCLFKWVNCSFKHDNNFTLVGSWTLYKEFSSLWVIINFLNLNIDFAFLISKLSLFLWLIQHGKNALLKPFVLHGICFNLPDDTDL